MPRSVLRVTAGNHYDYNDDNHYYDYDQDQDDNQEDGKIKCTKWEEDPPHTILCYAFSIQLRGTFPLCIYPMQKDLRPQMVLRNIWTTPNLS